jgi:hypothetical protein
MFNDDAYRKGAENGLHQVLLPSVDDIPRPFGRSSPHKSIVNTHERPVWQSSEVPPLPRYRPAIVSYGSHVILIGGSSFHSATECYQSCQVYDTRSNKWLKDNPKTSEPAFPNLIFARVEAKAVVANGTIIVLGGQAAGYSRLVSVEVNNPSGCATYSPCPACLPSFSLLQLSVSEIQLRYRY